MTPPVAILNPSPATAPSFLLLALLVSSAVSTELSVGRLVTKLVTSQTSALRAVTDARVTGVVTAGTVFPKQVSTETGIFELVRKITVRRQVRTEKAI
ncbi:hypothetical protein SAMN02982919_01036 [Giesbergeria anulus]|uniref:Uncharacterized protein n=1 Tax=Giesbergeria anulus TaxID=180197 RepID=A0A1H9I7C1_9BURK|nr:hypothetical protein SAMN02982919_01036 [Giesbergeria anulus]